MVLKGTAPDLPYCAGAEARTKRGGGGGARPEVVRAHMALQTLVLANPSPSRLRKSKRALILIKALPPQGLGLPIFKME